MRVVLITDNSTGAKFAPFATMPLMLSQGDLSSLIKRSPDDSSPSILPNGELFEKTWQYPAQLGQGYYREIYLRQGMHLEISDYLHHRPMVVEFSDRPHPIELHFEISDEGAESTSESGHYWLYSSGFAPAKQTLYQSHPRSLSLSLHIEPDVFKAVLGENAPIQLPELGSLLKPSDHPYASQRCRTTPAMQVILQQILNCPYVCAVWRLFLEGKVLELIALSLQASMPSRSVSAYPLKPDDVDRIQQAKAILLQDLIHPPSLGELARQVGLNECTLKRGFRQVFNTTAFGCLQAQRLDQARLLLLAGDLQVQQTAHAVGYHSRSHFSAAFRKRFGVSPQKCLAHHRDKNLA
ncbi:MAG: AraC family transcriptional regulator [Phormidesmis sp.]